MKYEIKQFDFDKATRDEWDALYQFQVKRMSETNPGDPIEDQKTNEILMKRSTDGFEVRSYYVTEKERPDKFVGWLRMRFVKEDSPSIVGNEHQLRNSLSVLKEHRRQGIGLELLKMVYDYAKENGKTLAMSGTSEEDGRSFLRILGAQETLETRDSRVVLEDIDWSMVDEWNREGSERSSDSTLEFYTKIPDEILEDYCRVYTEVLNQAPFDDLDIGHQIITPERWRREEARAAEAGATWLTAMIREKNGEISGLSDIQHLPSVSPMLYQLLTGVQEKHRGTGKGKWLKAAMLKRIKKEFPDIEKILTGNATSNAPMLSINERLGFKVHQELYAVQIETEKIGEYLAGK